jgi:hypothetical protein
MARKSKGMQAGRTMVFAVALGLFGYAAWISPTTIARVPLQLGSAVVGVSAAVSPNADNTLAKQLAAKEAELLKREAALEERAGGSNDTQAQYSLAASMTLFCLLGLNYCLDWRRNARARKTSSA